MNCANNIKGLVRLYILHWVFLLHGGAHEAVSLNKISQLSLASYWRTNSRPALSDVCHALIWYGRGETDLKGIESADSILMALTNEGKAREIFGSSPFFVTRNGLRFYLQRDMVAENALGE